MKVIADFKRAYPTSNFFLKIKGGYKIINDEKTLTGVLRMTVACLIEEINLIKLQERLQRLQRHQQKIQRQLELQQQPCRQGAKKTIEPSENQEKNLVPVIKLAWIDYTIADIGKQSSAKDISEFLKYLIKSNYFIDSAIKNELVIVCNDNPFIYDKNYDELGDDDKDQVADFCFETICDLIHSKDKNVQTIVSHIKEKIFGNPLNQHDFPVDINLMGTVTAEAIGNPIATQPSQGGQHNRKKCKKAKNHLTKGKKFNTFATKSK